MAENDESALALQQALQPDAASDAARTPGTVLCTKCRAENVRGQMACRACHAFLPANPSQFVHGLRARPSTALSDELCAAVAANRANIEADLGGSETISTLKAGVVTRLVHLEPILDGMAESLLRDGVFTGRGRTRAVFPAYLQALDRYVRLANLLGLERRERQVESMADYLGRLEAHESHRTRQDASGEAIDTALDREILQPAGPASEAEHGTAKETGQ